MQQLVWLTDNRLKNKKPHAAASGNKEDEKQVINDICGFLMCRGKNIAESIVWKDNTGVSHVARLFPGGRFTN